MTSGPLIWGYDTAPGKAIDGRTMVYPQARVLGGGSSINAQVFTRGCPQDYDGWAADDGCAGWSYADVLPYFLRSEGNDTFAGPQHGIDGPLGVSSGAPHPLTRVFVKAAQQAGLPFSADFNAGEQEGAGFYQTTTRNGKRCSTAVAYLQARAWPQEPDAAHRRHGQPHRRRERPRHRRRDRRQWPHRDCCAPSAR